MDIIERVKYWSRVAPEHPAHISGERILSYHNLDRNSDALAAYLSVSQSDNLSPFAVIGHKEPEMLVAFLAAVKSGHPYIPIDISLPQQRIEKIIASSQASVCLTPLKVSEILAEVSRSIPDFLPRKLNSEDPWYIIFTSGSTGDPKGVVITAACLESFLEWMFNEQHFSNQQEIFLNQAPFSFDLSVMDLYLNLATGGTLYSLTNHEIAEPKLLFISLARSNLSVWVSTPSFAQMCLNEPTFSENMLPGLRKFLFCGEILPPEVAVSIIQRFPSAEVWNTYGPTEATCATTSVNITENILSRYNPLPVGYPKPGSRILLIKRDGSSSEVDERGEIVIAGPNVSPGYLSQPDLTQKAFFYIDSQRAYRTGDLGHFHGGMLFFDGRLDNQIKLHGYRIEPGDIESNLLALPSVRDAVIIPRLKNGVPDSLAAFVILKKVIAQTEFKSIQMLKRELSRRLPAYMVPRHFFFIEQFPLTANGKVDRHKLAESLK